MVNKRTNYAGYIFPVTIAVLVVVAIVVSLLT